MPRRILKKIDAISATAGPGLLGGLLVGVVAGKTLAHYLNKPFIAVNHLEGHALSIKLEREIEYPYLLLLVSGGHTEFTIIKTESIYWNSTVGMLNKFFVFQFSGG